LRQLGAVGPYVPAPQPGSQQAVVHGWFGSPRTTGAHMAYLQKEKGLDGRDAPLFGGPVRDFAMRSTADPHQFRFSLSLKDHSPGFNFERYVTLFMRQVERDLQRPLDWVAAVHHDTRHPHAHVVLRGRDRDGQALYVTKDYLSHGLRYQASYIATALLGPVQVPVREPSREPDRTPQHVPGPAVEPARRAALQDQERQLTAQLAGALSGDLVRLQQQRDRVRSELRILETLERIQEATVDPNQPADDLEHGTRELHPDDWDQIPSYEQIQQQRQRGMSW